MPSFLDTQPGWSFDSERFPGMEWIVASEGRHHVHEYPHSPGGALEKLGRKLVHVQVQAVFSTTFRKYPGLYPGALNRMQQKHDAQLTAALVVPGLGTIQACLIKLTRRTRPRSMRSGEHVDLEFLEDQSRAFLTDALVDNSARSVDDSYAVFAATLANIIAAGDDKNGQLTAYNKVPGNLFTQLQSGVNSLTAIRDQADQYGQLVAARVYQIAGYCQSIDQLTQLNLPSNALMLDALHTLWASVVKLANDLQGNHTPLRQYLVPVDMPITQVSKNIYGDTTHATDLMNLNAIPDAFRVRGNTSLNYYPAP